MFVYLKPYLTLTKPLETRPTPRIFAGNTGLQRGITMFQGLRVKIENPPGSVRKGVDRDGKKWETTLSHAYGEVLGSMGVDGDPVDVFIGPNDKAKFVYGIHQTKKDGTGFDEQKFMMGFDDAMDAKAAFFKNYDIAPLFYTSVETIPLDTFKKKVMQSKKDPVPIHASKLQTAIELYAQERSAGPGIGVPVTVDGKYGRGVIVKLNGRRATIRFRNGEILTTDISSVHSLSDNYYKSRYSSVK